MNEIQWKLLQKFIQVGQTMLLQKEAMEIEFLLCVFLEKG